MSSGRRRFIEALFGDFLFGTRTGVADRADVITVLTLDGDPASNRDTKRAFLVMPLGHLQDVLVNGISHLILQCAIL